MLDQFTVCVLAFGDHYALAARCLQSITRTPLPHLRIGLNTVTTQTRELARQLAPGSVWDSDINLHKYPLMRRMLYERERITTPYTMWFDDDSFLTEPLSRFLPRVGTAMESADMLGSLYRIKWQGQQREYVKAQPWYTGRSTEDRDRVLFATGGWWVIRTELLYRFDYPWKDLDHRGGDVMLGELMYQQGLRLRNFRGGVKINADAAGNESMAQRRGFDQKPIGFDFNPSPADMLHKATTPLAVVPAASPTVKRRFMEL